MGLLFAYLFLALMDETLDVFLVFGVRAVKELSEGRSATWRHIIISI